MSSAKNKKPGNYVSRAAYKLESVAEKLGLNFTDKIMLDVGSSTGGFTDFALQHGAERVIAVDIGTHQLHEKLRADPRVELHEKTDILDIEVLSAPADIVVIDVSFISLRDVLGHIASLSNPSTQVVAMVKPQFEAKNDLKNQGVIKNETMRRQVLKDFELWVRRHFVVLAKADSEVTGVKGNRERFYLLQKLSS